MNEIIITKNSQINRHPENSWRRLSKGHVRVDRAFLLLFMLLSMASSCQESKMSEKKYTWGGAALAPKEYPVEIYDGALVSGDYAFRFGPIYGILKQGWGTSVKGMGSPDEPVALPDELRMTWYSIQEEKFYTGHWKLDKEQMIKLWEQGSINVRTGEKENFETLIVGLAPAGNVALWADGQRQVLLGTFQAHDTTITQETAHEEFEHFFRKEYRDAAYKPDKLYDGELYANLEGQGWPKPQLYLDYNKKYAWKFAVEGIDLGAKDYFFYECFNGERDMPLNTDSANTNLPKAIPAHTYVKWIDGQNQQWVADLKFKYEIIKKAFEQFEPTEKIEFVFQIDTSANVLNTYLRSTSKKVKIVGYEPALVRVDN
ncbi:DUF2931 family protein [Sphingobacterium sp.]|uniref:DUF2931 family protein n=1 Tax=Sphingobacterium sp. TaxID=341027 RepID=UPI0031D99843